MTHPVSPKKNQLCLNADVRIPARISKPSNPFAIQPSRKIQDIGYITSVEFFSDSTYIVVFNYGYGYTNKFSVKDSASFELNAFGKLSDIKVVGDSISFTATYHDTPLTVKAKKASEISLSNNQKALLKNWSLTTQEDGAAYLEGRELEVGDISFFFSASGSFLMKFSHGDESYAQAFNWKLFPGKENSLLIQSHYSENENYYNYIKIVEVTNTTLKVQLISVEPKYDENQNIIGQTEEIDYTFVLTAK